MNRLSGPLLDRIDIHVDVPALTFDEIATRRADGPTSADVRREVQEARDLQRQRYNGTFDCNARIDSTAVRDFCQLNNGATQLLQRAMDQLGLSARAYDKILRVARTLADLDRTENIAEHHVAEAVQYRSLDRELF